MFTVPAYACIDGGGQIDINNALQGPNAGAILCLNAVFNLTGPVQSTIAGQQVYTEGRPTGSSRAVSRVTNIAEPRAFVGHFSKIRFRRYRAAVPSSSLG